MQVSTCWNEALGLADSLLILRDLALYFARESGEYAAELVPLIENGDWPSIVGYEVDYNRSAPPSDVLAARQALGFFQKLEPLEIGVDKEQVALQKFIASESLCEQTNELFRAVRNRRASVRPRVWRQLLAAKRKIHFALGRCPSLAELDLRFGPGATTSTNKIDASPQQKLADGLMCSTDVLASGLLPELLREVPHWTAAHDSAWSIDEDGWLLETVSCGIVPGRLAFVPKSAKTYRSIVVEPVLNTVVQAGIGKWMRGRLRQIGVDITDQTLNQRMALQGSLQGDLATIDLSSASDLIATELCRFLLPEPWYRLLSAFRTSEVQLKGSDQTLFLQKFSSMGNGFTFPLETLIFYSLACAAVGTTTGVNAYGDDIIVPTEKYTAVLELLEFAGFLVNREKSFASGPFRESCGADYYKGINVRPFYQKHLVSGQTLFTLYNFMKRELREDVCDLVLRYIPRPIRLYGPDGYGDGHLISDSWIARKRDLMRKRGWAGAYFESYTAIPRKRKSRYPGDWVSPLYSIYARGVVSLTPPGVEPVLVLSPGSVSTRGFRPEWTLPGDDGYAKTLIYTLAA